jgi:hypothetical protein
MLYLFPTLFFSKQLDQFLFLRFSFLLRIFGKVLVCFQEFNIPLALFFFREFFFEINFLLFFKLLAHLLIIGATKMKEVSIAQYLLHLA